MKAKIHAALECECEAPLRVAKDSNDVIVIFCENIDCPHHGKIFRQATIELEEI